MKFHVVQVYIRKIHTSKLTKCLHHLSLSPQQVVQIANSSNQQTITSQCGCIHTRYEQEGLHWELKMTHIYFTILNSGLPVMYLRSIQGTNFYVVKQLIQLQDTLGISDILEDILCSLNQIYGIISQKSLQCYRINIGDVCKHLEANNFLFLNRYKIAAIQFIINHIDH